MNVIEIGAYQLQVMDIKEQNRAKYSRGQNCTIEIFRKKKSKNKHFCEQSK